MNTSETIRSRKSVRSYTGDKITDEELGKVLQAAYAAPVGMGMYENIHLLVINSPELLKEIDSNCSEFMKQLGPHPLYGAPTLIVVSSAAPAKALENVAYSNTAIIVQNMALEATELGVGCCHIWGAVAAINANAELLKKLNLPKGFVPQCGLVLGKTKELYEMREIPNDRIKTSFIAD